MIPTKIFYENRDGLLAIYDAAIKKFITPDGPVDGLPVGFEMSPEQARETLDARGIAEVRMFRGRPDWLRLPLSTSERLRMFRHSCAASAKSVSGKSRTVFTVPTSRIADGTDMFANS